MKGSRSVCLLCRHRAATVRQVCSPHWQQSQASPFATTVCRNDAATNGKPTIDQPEQSGIRKYIADTPQRDSSIRISQNAPGSKVDKPSPSADTLFQQIVREQLASGHGTNKLPSPDSQTNLELFRVISELREMIETDRPPADVFTYLQTEIYPLIRRADVHPPQVFHQVVSELLEKLVVAKKADMHSDTLPALADILRVYVDIGELKPPQWASLVGELIRQILALDAGKRDKTRQETMLMDLVESWKVLSLPQIAVSPAEEGEITDGFWFPRLEKYHLSKASGNFVEAVNKLFPHLPSNQPGAPVAVLAIATYALLLDKQITSAKAKQSAISFIIKIADLITFVRTSDKALRTEIARTFPGLQNYIMGQWPSITTQLRLRLQSAHTFHGPVRAFTPPAADHGPRKIDGSGIRQRLSRAYALRKIAAVDEVWEGFLGSSTIPKDRIAELREHPDLFDSFVNTYMALNKANQAIQVLKTMERIGLKPTLRTWNSMLDGCKKARNITAIKNVWTKLAASGMELDSRIWTTRVSGLIESGDVKAGIQVLEEMTRLWKADPETRSSAAIEPTIEPVNAAIQGLIRDNKADVAEKLLAWARKQGIKPDVYTFNTMLRLYIRDGTRDKDVKKLFTTMQELGVLADEATFTIVLDAASSKFNAGDPEQQAQLVSQMLSEMEAVGLETNMIVYGKMVYILLQSGSLKAANALLEYIWADGKKVSVEIYTMILEHLFSCSPPNINAIEKLVEKRRALHRDDLDRVFYDRLIQGFAATGHPDAALREYYRVTSAGVPVFIGSLTYLLNALLSQRRWEDARNLVISTKRMAREHGYDNERFWAHRFWRIAEEYGVIDQDTTTAAPS